jgi:hypothetical protein
VFHIEVPEHIAAKAPKKVTDFELSNMRSCVFRLIPELQVSWQVDLVKTEKD